MTLKFTILGCGSSGGVPRAGFGWGACDPDNPKNRRRRCSLQVEKTAQSGKTTLIIDTGADFREQMLAADVQHIDGVIYTHDHADHTNGMDDLRPYAIKQRQRIKVYCDDITSAQINLRFSYCFQTPPGSEYPPILEEHRLTSGKTTIIAGQGGTLDILPVSVKHGSIDALSIRIGAVMYTPDISAIYPETLTSFENLEIWILDSLRYASHVSHFSVEEALHWIEKLKPKRAILTNLHHDLDYQTLKNQLPPYVEPAFDGLNVSISS